MRKGWPYGSREVVEANREGKKRRNLAFCTEKEMNDEEDTK